MYVDLREREYIGQSNIYNTYIVTCSRNAYKPRFFHILKKRHIVLMFMVAINHMITIPISQENWLKDNPEVSLSKITQQSICEIMEFSKISAATLREEIRKKDAWKEIAEKAQEFLKNKGLLEQFLEARGY